MRADKTQPDWLAERDAKLAREWLDDAGVMIQPPEPEPKSPAAREETDTDERKAA